jgi:hypothetical protein
MKFCCWYMQLQLHTCMYNTVHNTDNWGTDLNFCFDGAWVEFQCQCNFKCNSLCSTHFITEKTILKSYYFLLIGAAFGAFSKVPCNVLIPMIDGSKIRISIKFELWIHTACLISHTTQSTCVIAAHMWSNRICEHLFFCC